MRIEPTANPDWDGHQEVHFFEGESAGLRAYLAIHRRGPLGIAGGGCRMMQYPSDEHALRDALRLSKAMGQKMLLADASSGGAKCVVIGDPSRDKNDALLAALARAIDSLDGRFVAGADVGTSVEDLRVLTRHTPYVEAVGSKRDIGSEMTAIGVMVAMLAAAERRLGSVDVSGVRIAVQGVGKVGGLLARLLHDRGAELIVADIDADRAARLAEQLGARAMPASEILGADAAIFAPCALGDVLDDDSVKRLRCQLVVGSANNPLARAELADVLRDRDILYVPDFVVNIGGVLAGAHPYECATPERAQRLAERVVGGVTREVLERADSRGVTPLAAATQIVAEREAARERRDESGPRSTARGVMSQLWKRRWFARSVMSLRSAVASAAEAAAF